MIDAAFLVTSFATLFVVVDPIGLVPMFIALTNGKTVQRRREIAVQAVLIAGGWGVTNLYWHFHVSLSGVRGNFTATDGS
jgi:small neutral amino acid transporter SnatA (MarC family)